METNLSKKTGVGAMENVRLEEPEIIALKEQLDIGWEALGEKKLKRDFKFPDFKKALDFVNQVGEVAEKLNHHPDIDLTYGQVGIELSTHSAGGLTRADFILAARIDAIHRA